VACFGLPPWKKFSATERIAHLGTGRLLHPSSWAERDDRDHARRTTEQRYELAVSQARQNLILAPGAARPFE